MQKWNIRMPLCICTFTLIYSGEWYIKLSFDTTSLFSGKEV